MWCDSCDQLTYSTNTTYRITKNGRSIAIYHCAHCKATIEVERVKGPTIRIKNKQKHRQ